MCAIGATSTVRVRARAATQCAWSCVFAEFFLYKQWRSCEVSRAQESKFRLPVTWKITPSLGANVSDHLETRNDFVLTLYWISYRNNFVIDHKVVTDRNGISFTNTPQKAPQPQSWAGRLAHLTRLP